MNTHQSIRHMTYLALFIAIIVVMTLVPSIGYIQTGIFSIVLVHIPVIIGALVLQPIDGLLLATVWGVGSFYYALTIATPEALIFQNPLVSILPRVLVGVVLYFIVKHLKKIKKLDQYVLSGIVAVIATLSNTLFVLVSIFTFAYAGMFTFNQSFAKILAIVFSVNVLAEITVAVLIVPVVVRALNKVKNN
jgi:uncharacterized membrane protein